MKRWFGTSDIKTSPSYLASSHYYHWDAFQEVVKLLNDLQEQGHVQLIYIDDEASPFVVAYRFTSDTAYNQYHGTLFNYALGLESGIWNTSDQAMYQKFLGSDRKPLEGSREVAP